MKIFQAKKKNLKVGPLAAEITLMQKSTEKHVSGIGLMHSLKNEINSNFEAQNIGIILLFTGNET